MKKRMFSLIIVLSMLIVGIPMIAHAETSGKCGDNLTWTLDDMVQLQLVVQGI